MLNIVLNAIAILYPTTRPSVPSNARTFDPYHSLREWLNQLEIKDAAIAHSICRLIPAQCPFERKIELLGRTILEIPPLCKLNPVYEEVVSLRFRALCYLADCCGEDIQRYC
jgi:hypothetical protein